MAKTNAKRYALYPVSLNLELLLGDHESKYSLFHYCVYDAASRLLKKMPVRTFLGDVLYSYSFNKESLSDSLINTLDYLREERIIIEDTSADFDHYGQYRPDYNAEALSKYLDKNPTIKVEVMQWCKVRMALKIFQPDADYNTVPMILNSIHYLEEKYILSLPPYCNVGIDFLYNYLKKSRSNYDLFKLAALTGISSIIGLNKKWAATTKNMILARAFGCRNYAELEKLIKTNEDARKLFETYSTRRKFDKLKVDLLSSGLVACFFGFRRHTFISITKDFDSIKTDIAESIKKKDILNEARHNREELEMMLAKKCTP